MMIYFRFQILPVALWRWRCSSHCHGGDKTADPDRKQIVKPGASASNCMGRARREEKDMMIGADTKQTLMGRLDDQDLGRVKEGKSQKGRKEGRKEEGREGGSEGGRERAKGKNAQHKKKDFMRLDESLLAGRFTSAEDYTFLLGLTTDWNTKLRRDEVGGGGGGEA